MSDQFVGRLTQRAVAADHHHDLGAAVERGAGLGAAGIGGGGREHHRPWPPEPLEFGAQQVLGLTGAGPGRVDDHRDPQGMARVERGRRTGQGRAEPATPLANTGRRE